jgi:phosphate starvation-inducible protein PhoH and related proteins
MPKNIAITLHANLTRKQKMVLHSRKQHALLEGPAGTAKTYIALAKAMIALQRDEVEKIIVVRSPVAVRDMGFLPGDADEKMDVFAAPYVGLLQQLSPKMNFKALVSKGMLEFHPTSYLRGMTFDDAFVVLDEAQNFQSHELHTAITRIGEGTKLYICGDSDQTDLKGGAAEEHKRELGIIRRMEEDFDVIRFTTEDIVRSDFVRRYYETRARTMNLAVLGADPSPTGFELPAYAD